MPALTDKAVPASGLPSGITKGVAYARRRFLISLDIPLRSDACFPPTKGGQHGEERRIEKDRGGTEEGSR